MVIRELGTEVKKTLIRKDSEQEVKYLAGRSGGRSMTKERATLRLKEMSDIPRC